MATNTPKTRRKSAAPEAAAAKPVAVPEAVKAPAAKKAAAKKTPAKRTAGQTTAKAVTAPVVAKPAAKKVANKTATRKPVVEKATPAAPAGDVPTPSPAVKQAVAKKSPAKKSPAQKVGAKVANAPPVVAPAPAPVAPPPAAPAPQARPAARKKPVRQPARPAPVVAVPVAPAPAAAETAEPTALVETVLAVLTAPAEAPLAAAPASGKPSSRQRGRDRQRNRQPPADTSAQPASAEPDAPVEVPPPPPAPTGPAHSEIRLSEGDARQVLWLPGHACPPAVLQAARDHLNDQGHLPPEDDAALPLLQRLAFEAHHTLRVDDAVWPFLAANRDARTRLAVLEAAYPQGPGSAAVNSLLRLPLAPFQAEGALFAVVAGRALIADERGLGKGVMALAAVQCWRQHFGVRRVALVCAAGQRLAWQRAWARFVPQATAVQVLDGGLHQRQSMWSAVVDVRILSPEALASDAAHLARWAPDLVIVDEPQGLGLQEADWAALQAPHAIVLCGASLADEPALMRTLVAWLDVQRQGPLAALLELQSASETGRPLSDADVERLSDSLSRLMLQRTRDDVADQLPALVHSERLVGWAPGQRAVHDQHLATLRRLLAGWLASGYLSDDHQWRLAQAVRDVQRACHRADPHDGDSALAEATVQAIEAQRAAWAAIGGVPAAVLCASDADRDQLRQRLGEHDDLRIIGPGEPLPAGLAAIVQVGVPWRPRRNPAGPRGQVPAGQQWVYLVAHDSLECGLFDTLAWRAEVPRGLLDAGGARAYLTGAALADWLAALQAAVASLDASLQLGTHDLQLVAP